MNKATKWLMSFTVLSVLFSVSALAQQSTISDARALDLGTEVTVEGILTSPDHNFFNNQFFIQDTTAGISIFIDGDNSDGTNSDGNSPFASGDSIRVTGTLIDTNGLLEIEITPTGSYTILSSGNALPEPVNITEADISLDSEYQSMRVRLTTPVSLDDGETWPADAQTSSGVNVDVVAGDSTFTLRIDRDESFYDGAPAPSEKFQLTGNLGAFFSAQIFPFYDGDVANAHKVDFTINTATHPDTVMESHFLQLRGTIGGGTGTYAFGEVIDWNASSTFVPENVGGDYWELSAYILEGDGLNFKVWSGYDVDTGTNNGDGGWEITGSGRPTRMFTVNQDTSVTIWSESETAPFETNEDGVTLFFRVNVGAFIQDQSFNPATDKVGIRGNPDVFGNPGDWSATAIYLDMEERVAADGTPIEDDNLFYSGTVLVDQEAADTLGVVPYKYVLETTAGTAWDNVNGNQDGNRFTNIPSQDSTIHWSNFQEKAPTAAEIVTANITFEVNTAVVEILGFFDSGLDDDIEVRGEPPLDWSTNAFNTATFDDQDVLWRLTQPFTKAVGSSFKYKYYIDYGPSRYDDTSDGYIQAVAESENDDFGYEEPVTTGGGDRFFTVSADATQSEGLQYFNDVSTGGVIQSQNTPNGTLSVTFEIDMGPALDADIPFRPGVDSLYLQMESKFTALTNGFRSGGGYFDDIVENGSPADLEFLRYTPVDGETNIYSLTLDLDFPTLNDFGYVVRYGEPFADYDGMVVNGDGFAAGRRYYQFIEPVSVTFAGEDPFFGDVYQTTWPETYKMDRVTWAPDDLEFDIQPDYVALATSSDFEPTRPEGFSLSQNYPNPFNPSTNISFNLPQASTVKLTVYNVLGQEVATLLNNKAFNSGTHSVSFNASALSSGMYIYRLEAGSFTSTKRMMLIK